MPFDLTKTMKMILHEHDEVQMCECVPHLNALKYNIVNENFSDFTIVYAGSVRFWDA